MGELSILIQDRNSKQFYQSRGKWTDDPATARSFASAVAAFYFAAEAGLHNVEIVMRRAGAEIEAIISRSR